MSAAAFEYQGIDQQGRERRGVTHASDRDAAYRQVRALGLTPTLLKAARARGPRRGKAIGARELAHVTQQLGVFIEARIPLSDALATIAGQESDPRLRRVLTDVASRVQAGARLSDSMASHGSAFGEVYIESLRAAEHSGNMIRILAHLAEMLERSDETRRQVRSALLYPAIVISTLSLAVSFLVVFVIPRFATLYQSRGVELPLLTRALMSVGTFAREWWWALILAAVTGAFVARRAIHDPRVRAVVELALHRVPAISSLLRGLALARFSRVLGLSIASGIGLIDALTMSGRASGRAMLLADATRVADQVRAGGRLTDVLTLCPYIPVFVRRMLSAGEQSGELPRMCENVARHYDRETQHLSKNLGTVVEPVLVVGIAAVVLVVALAVFLPMWQMLKIAE